MVTYYYSLKSLTKFSQLVLSAFLLVATTVTYYYGLKCLNPLATPLTSGAFSHRLQPPLLRTLSAFLLIWFACGNYWVFGVYRKVRDRDVTESLSSSSLPRA